MEDVKRLHATRERFEAPAHGDRRRTVVVTGATGGIGAAVVTAASSTGDQVIAVGRSAETLHARCAGIPGVTPTAIDLRDPGDLPDTLTGLDRVDALVHCAGVAEVAEVADTPPAVWQETFAVNVFGAAELTRALLPAVRTAGGHVVFVTASPGLHAVPRWSAYTASKAAVRELAAALRQEEDGNGVRVTCVHPGAVGTALLRRVRDAFGRPYDQSRTLSPESVAWVVLSVLDQPPDVHLLDVSLRASRPRR